MRVVFIAVIAAFGISVRADSTAIPLVDPADPVRILDASLDFTDSSRPVMIVNLENEMDIAVSTRDVWLDWARFYTKGEMLRAGNRKVWDCGMMLSAAGDQKQAELIAPHGRIVANLSLAECQHNPEHEHFFVEVQILGRMSSPSWKREPGEFSRLLSAAMPHE